MLCPSVLVVDDTPQIRNALQRHLERAGFAVHTAADGQEALELVRGGQLAVDVVLSDVHMPRMDGLTLGRLVGEVCPDLPVVLMTAEPARVAGWQGLRAVRGLLEKPFTVPALLEQLGAACGAPVAKAA